MALSEILACPVCRGSLVGVTCGGCGRTYLIHDGVLDLTPVPPPDAEVRDRWGLWEALQANGEHAYTADPLANLSVGEREDVRAFARFAQLQGAVLDIGCGPQALPSYGAGIAGELVGIDPLLGVQPRGFTFVKAIAEYLPFRDASFDRVLFATSIDHLLVPALAVAEARRVLRPGGAVVVWVGEPVAAPSLRTRARGAARRLRRGQTDVLLAAARAAARLAAARARTALRRPAGDVMTIQTARATLTFEVPAGAADAFHVVHVDAAAVTAWLQAAGLTVEATERPLPGHCFVRARV